MSSSTLNAWRASVDLPGKPTTVPPVDTGTLATNRRTLDPRATTFKEPPSQLQEEPWSEVVAETLVGKVAVDGGRQCDRPHF